MVDQTRASRARSALLPRGGVDPARAARVWSNKMAHGDWKIRPQIKRLTLTRDAGPKTTHRKKLIGLAIQFELHALASDWYLISFGTQLSAQAARAAYGQHIDLHRAVSAFSTRTSRHQWLYPQLDIRLFTRLPNILTITASQVLVMAQTSNGLAQHRGSTYQLNPSMSSMIPLRKPTDTFFLELSE